MRPFDDLIERTLPVVAPTAAAAGLRRTMVGVRLEFRGMRTGTPLEPEERARAAAAFDASASWIFVAKRQIDPAHPAVGAVIAARGRIRRFWRTATLPFPEPGVRLVPRARIESFAATVDALRIGLHAALAETGRAHRALKQAASRHLGRLYDPADDPAALWDRFDVSWGFANLDPPADLARLSPRLEARERDRVAAQFEQAVRLARETFRRRLARRLAALIRALGAPTDTRGALLGGQRTALVALCDRVGSWKLGIDPQLDALFDEARGAVHHAPLDDADPSRAQRRAIARALQEIASRLAALGVDHAPSGRPPFSNPAVPEDRP